MARAATATINLNAIRSNYRLAKSVAPNQLAVAVIKADAYGHGAVKVALALEDEADAFAVACIEEGMELRKAGITRPILLLEGFFSPDELNCISKHNFWCTLHSWQQITDLNEAQIEQPLNVWLKMDSGMHRLGISPASFSAAYAQVRSLPQVNEVVLMTHFSCADEPELDVTQQQLDLFRKHTNKLNAPCSLANSAALLAHKKTLSEWQRPGIMLYGASPFTQPQPLADQLVAAMSLTSEIIAVRDLEAGEAVGYGRTWICERATRVGTVAMGYADGYPRHAKNGTPIRVDGQASQIIGRVSMDMLTVDLSHLPNAKEGSVVELWGENLPAALVASHCDTIPYTLFTGITQRVHKQYINE